MATKMTLTTPARWVAAATALGALGYVGYAAVTWARYGNPSRGRAEDDDPLLDRFMPFYDVVERHHTLVRAPAEVTLDVAAQMDLASSRLARGIFKAREIILGASPDQRELPRGLMAQMRALGWGVLTEVPGREIVVGAVTKPWEANVTFQSLPPDGFAKFDEPDYVKIAWTLRADPIDAHTSIFRSETRALATDAAARSKFRTYWAFLSPGIIIIRRVMLGPLRREAERAAR